MDYNTGVVLIGTCLLGIAAGVIGSFAVLRRRALMGDALAHAALPGICVAFLIIGERHFAGFLLGALVSGSLGVGIVTLLRHSTRIKEDAAIGIVLSVFFGGGIVLSSTIQHMPGGNRSGLDTYIFGKTAAMVRQDVMIIGGVCVFILAVSMLLYKEFKALSFDREYASAQGLPVLALDFAMMTLLVLVTVAGLPAVGVVLMAAMLIIPGAAARFWTDRLHWMLMIAAFIGALTGLFGTMMSARYAGLPAGPIIVLVGASMFVASMLFAPRRGIVARVLSRRRLEVRTMRQNLLRTMYELAEPDPAAKPPVTPVELTSRRAWSVVQARRALERAQAAGMVESVDGMRYRFTEAGLEEAVCVVRTHRLWEVFLIEEAHVAADHVDRDADSIEHVLGAEEVRHLERRLVEMGRWPKEAPLPPPSPHGWANGGDAT